MTTPVGVWRRGIGDLIARLRGDSVPLKRIVADANAWNHEEPSYRVAPSGTKVTMSEATAVRAVISECNEGRGTRLVTAGLVIGRVKAGSAPLLGDPRRPTGKHIAPSTESVRKSAILTWMGAFVSVKTTTQPFCDFGRAANLLPLPVFSP